MLPGQSRKSSGVKSCIALTSCGDGFGWIELRLVFRLKDDLELTVSPAASVRSGVHPNLFSLGR